MITLIVVLLILLGAIAIGLFASGDYGMISLQLLGWQIDIKPLAALAVLLLGFIGCLLLIWLLGQLFSARRRWRTRSHQRRGMRARKALTDGLIELAEGHWQQAEKLLVRASKVNDDLSWINFLGAARAAQQLQADQRRDDYLKQAVEANPQAEIAVSLVQAELQLQHEQIEQALATLTRLRERSPNNVYVMRLLVRLYQELKDWRALATLLPELEKRDAISIEKITKLEVQLAEELLDAHSDSSLTALRELWLSLPKRARQSIPLKLSYCRVLGAHAHFDEAEKFLRGDLLKYWSEAVAREYGLLKPSDLGKQLNHAEAWLKDHGNSPALLLSLGRICMRRQLWGKAKLYFESSLEHGKAAETHLELAELLDQLGETETAREHYQHGLRLALQDPAKVPLVATAAERPALSLVGQAR